MVARERRNIKVLLCIIKHALECEEQVTVGFH